LDKLSGIPSNPSVIGVDRPQRFFHRNSARIDPHLRCATPDGIRPRLPAPHGTTRA